MQSDRFAREIVPFLRPSHAARSRQLNAQPFGVAKSRRSMCGRQYQERRASMQRVHLNGADLEYEVQGAGEPLLLIHGSILADAYHALRAEPRIANHYRVILYH